MFRETTLMIEPIESEMRQQIVELERHNKALKASIRLLDKCLTEASDDRDRYKAQLDKLNASFDDYIRREKIISEPQKALDSGFFDDNQAIKDDVLNRVHGKSMTVEEYLGGKTLEELKEEWIG